MTFRMETTDDNKDLCVLWPRLRAPPPGAQPVLLFFPCLSAGTATALAKEMQVLDQHLARALRVLLHRGERRIEVRRRGDVVESNHRHVPRHAAAAVAQRADDADRNPVAGGEDRVECGARIEQREARVMCLEVEGACIEGDSVGWKEERDG